MDDVIAIRPVRLPDDEAQLLALDRSFTTDHVYRIVRSEHSFTLDEVAVRPPLRKDFPLADDLGAERAWEQGFVAEEADIVVGFAAIAHRPWNRRTELWHFYVAPSQRGQGVGRALIETVVSAAQEAGTRCVWLETSNFAYPAIQFYRRLGFEICGLDLSLYDPASVHVGEAALFFARAV